MNLPHWPQPPPKRTGVGVTAADYAKASGTYNQVAAAYNTQTVVVAGQTIDASTLAAVVNLDPATVLAQGQAAGEQIASQLGATAKAKWDAETTSAANDQRKLAGINAAIDIATSKKFDMNNPEDSGKVIAVIAGAMACVVPVGTILSAALSLLYGIALGLSKIFESVGLIGPFGCFSSNNWTPANVAQGIATIDESSKGLGDGLPPIPIGSFAALVMPALLKNTADQYNCTKNTYSNIQIVAAMAHLWNESAVGPPMTIYVPAMGQSLQGGPPDGIFAVRGQARYAFQPASDVNIGGQVTNGDGSWFIYDTPTGAVPPFILQLNGSTLDGATAPAITDDSAFLQSAQTQAAITAAQAIAPMDPAAAAAWNAAQQGKATSTPMSVGEKVAVGAGVVGVVAIGGTFLYAHATKQPVGSVVKNAWRKMTGRR